MADLATNNPSTCRKEYEDAKPKWLQVEDAAGGEAAVKGKATTYLPQPNAHDDSAENKARYNAYLVRACYYNATGRTEAGLLGLAFGKDPEIKIPAAIEPMLSNIDGAGVTLIQQAQQTLGQVLKTGRAGLLVDYPPTDGNVSRADQARKGVQPTITYYPATSIVNWRTERRGGQVILSMVVLLEVHESSDGFSTEIEDQYRVLRLDETYKVEVWRKGKAPDADRLEWTIVENYEPQDAKGNPWTELPFTFIGAKNNDAAIDDAPLYDLAMINLAHYRNSADYEESVFVIGQPQIWVMGVSQDWIKIWKDEGIYFGARAVGAGPPGATVTLIQPSPNTLAREAMQDKEKQMAALGARLIQEGTVAKTATQQNSEDAVAQSVLSLCCDNVSSAYTQALTWFAAFANADGEVIFEISTEFSSRHLDPQELATLIQLVQQGLMPKSELWVRLRRVGAIDSAKTDADLRNEIEGDMPKDDSTDLDDDDEPASRAA